MIKWQSKTFRTAITLAVKSSEAIAAPTIKSEYDTNPEQVEELIKAYLSETYGAYGHRLGDRCTGFDLSVALKHDEFTPYGFELIEGAEFIAPPQPVPEGAVS